MPQRRNRRSASADAGKHPSSRFGSPATGSTERRYPKGTTPEERTLIDHSRSTVRRGQQVHNADGSTSTLLSGSVEHPRLNSGKPTLVPHVWEGKVVKSDDEVAERAIKTGRAYPSYDTHDDATVVAKRISRGLGTKTPPKPLK